ncbi:type II toxin-antitoxin system antitoxin SocA domain-containing protein [Paracoccus sp. S3-43]|uniref:Panacea domain-containing protein n=1 Tax=Paracoccus sp. S3-43 TaxID=3030011 RepID=UPI0023AF2A1C|nr:type II toxin-antitoxin system antitoxin SocA domain-containing protein [Paracoccus sp. S3-43]WEF24630.1 DUF4065 domain-containing protein [Paracoccus sp. S3-43]
MPVPFTPLAVANAFITEYAKGVGIEHMKLQKLVYCSYGWWLQQYGLKGLRLTTEGPEIWRHGPVFSSLYKTLKVFGRAPILTPQSSGPFAAPDAIDDVNVESLIHWIWSRYGHMSSFALSDLTHKQGTPWYRVAMDHNFSVPFHTNIPDEYIFEEFTKLANNTGQASLVAQAENERGRPTIRN